MELVSFVSCTLFGRSPVSSVGVVTRLRAGRSGVPIPAGQEIFLFLKRPDWLWGAPCLLFSWHRGFFGCKSAVP